ncbi:MAG: hypothetical protein Q8L66_14470 [Caulobacter sp.]|nr:hypothetical protein [Caulobacter sp.]
MSFREKTAWISLFTVVLVMGPYFYGLIVDPPQGAAAVGGLIKAIIAVIVLQVALHIAVAVWSPKAAQAATDERERLIALKADRVGYYVLASGAFLAAATIHLGFGRAEIANGVLAALVAAEILRSGAQIVGFRRGV